MTQPSSPAGAVPTGPAFDATTGRTALPTTGLPTTGLVTTALPSTAVPTTALPTSALPATGSPTDGPVGPAVRSAPTPLPSPLTARRRGLRSVESWFEGSPSAARRLDGFAVAGFVFSLPGLAPVAAVLAAVSLRRLRRSGARGRRLALAALAISGCWVITLGVAAALGVYGENQAGIGRSSEITELVPGQCFAADLDGGILHTVRIADCAAEHAGEAYARVSVSLSGLSTTAREAAATRQCVAAFGRFVGKPYEESELDLYYGVLADQAVADGNVLCLVGSRSDGLTGSVRGSGR